MTQRDTETSPKCALIIGHPGHELRVWGWIRRAKPVVAILTDGSGRSGRSRIHLTTSLLDIAGAARSSAYGVTTDRRIYQAILDQDAAFFQLLSEQVADVLASNQIDCVVGDAIEGFNPTHDLCRLVVDRAAMKVGRANGHHIRNLSFSLDGDPRPQRISSTAWQVKLGPAELSEKLAYMRAYAAAAGGNLVVNIQDGFRRYGEAAFAHEVLDIVDSAREMARFEAETPYYETYGERQVANGHYREVIRYREHIAPLFHQLSALP